MEPSPSAWNESLISQLSEARRDVAAMSASLEALEKNVKKEREMLLEEMVGHDLVRAMRANRETAERYLGHPDARHRFTAIAIIREHWKPDQEFATTCERLAIGDDDALVRSSAVSALGAFYDSSSNQRIGAMLAQLVRAPSEPTVLRESAYEALWQLARGANSLNEHILMSTAELQFPEGVDWSLVFQFLTH